MQRRIIRLWRRWLKWLRNGFQKIISNTRKHQRDEKRVVEPNRQALQPQAENHIQQDTTGSANQIVGAIKDNGIAIANARDVYIGSKSTRSDRPFQARSLPISYTLRPAALKAVKALLLTNEENIPGVLVISAIYGLGGIGKTVLASALAYDEDVRERFADGVLWADLGQQPEILSYLGNWIQALGDYNYKPTTIEAASTYLRTLLTEKRMLLVVDDAWNYDHVEPFCVGSVGCRVLVTTREARIPGAIRYDLNVMTPEESLEILRKVTKKVLTGESEKQALSLAKEVGYLPLALELAAAQIAEGVPWTDLLADLRLEVARLETLDLQTAETTSNEEKRKRYSLVASFNLSLRRLSLEHLRLFAWLGVLPEDVNITQEMATTLWEVTPRKAGEILRLFRSKALLSLGVEQPEQQTTYRIHDLMHDMAKKLLTVDTITPDLPGLGLNLPQAHSKLLERYYTQTKDGLWHTLPKDGYIHAHLTWHFQQAQQLNQIHQLLQEETTTLKNGWYEACDRLGETAIFLTDVARAWQLAEEMFEENPSDSISLQCFYALIIASLNSLVANLPKSLLITLVTKKVWTPEQGLAYTLQSSNPSQKADLLTELINHLPPNLKELALEKAFAAAKLIQYDWNRADALIALADKLPPELLLDALAAAKLLRDEFYRAKVLIALADKLPPELLPDALAAAKLLRDEFYRADFLIALADKLPPELLPDALAAAKLLRDNLRANFLIALAGKLPDLLPDALAAAKLLRDEGHRALALTALANKLQPELLPDALAAAKLIQNDKSRADALIALADKLPDLLPDALAVVKLLRYDLRANYLIALVDKLPSVLPDALAAANFLTDERYRTNALIALAGKLPPELLPDVFAAIKLPTDKEHRAHALIALADKLPSVLPDALAAAKLIENESERANFLIALADKLPSVLPDALTAVNEALAAAKLIEDDKYRANALIALAVKAPSILPDALAAAKLLRDEWDRADFLIALVDKLPPELLPDVFAVAKLIEDEFYRASALIALAGKLPPELLPDVFAAAKLIEDEFYRASALIALAGKLPPELLPDVFAAAKLIENEWHRANTLIALADKLPSVLPDALAAAKLIEDEWHRANTLIALADKLPSVLPDALAAAKLIEDEWHRANTLIALADKLPSVLPDALAAAKLIEDESERASALIALAGKLPDLLPDALAAAKLIQHDKSRAYALIASADKLPDLLPNALAAAKLIQHESERASALIALADKLPPELLPEIFAAAKLLPEYSRVLSALADKLPPELLPDALAAAKLIQNEEFRADALVTLANKLPDLLPDALATTKLLWNEYNRANALSALADKLPPELLPDALAAAKLIENEYNRAKALSALALPLSKMPTNQLFDIWQQTLHQLSLRTRHDLLTDIEKLVPVIFALGGEAAIAEVARAIQNVARWWQ